MEIASLAIVGAVVSVVVQIIKVTAGTSKLKSVGLSVFISLLFAAGYYQFSQNTALWEAFLQVLVYANGIYALIIKQLE